MSTSQINEAFSQEYNSDLSVRRYTAGTAGHGISHLLNHVYGGLYLDIIQAQLRSRIGPAGIRVLEYGCGGGMNLITLMRLLRENGIPIDEAYGTDFAPVLIEAAKKEASTYLPRELAGKALFTVARNENLVEDMSRQLGKPAGELTQRFNLVIGVNTSRYCHRLKQERTATEQLLNLLVPGGISIMIDMNDRFPLFRSKIRGKKVTDDPLETYIPSLSEYARPFKEAGFEIIKEGTFCWIPHSAGKAMCLSMRALSPILQTLFPRRAMRSLVIARKPQVFSR